MAASGRSKLRRSAPTARQGRVREIDFRRPSKFARDQIRRIEASHEAFCRAASSRLSAELRTELQLEVLGTDQLPYGTVMSEEVPPQALVTVLTLRPLGTEMALIMDTQLVLCFADRLLGGTGSPPQRPDGVITEVEIAVAGRAMRSLVEVLSATWIDLAETTFEITGNSTAPLSVQIVPPSEPTLLLNLSAQIDDQVSIVTILMPHRSVESIMHLFDQARFGPAQVNGEHSAALQRNIRGVCVELRAEVGAVNVPLERVLGLRAGDVIGLRRAATKGVTLLAGDIPAYEANPGRNGNWRAVQVHERFGGLE